MAGMLGASRAVATIWYRRWSRTEPHVAQLRAQDPLLMPCQRGPGRTVGRVPLRLLAAPSRLGASRARKPGGLPLAAY